MATLQKLNPRGIRISPAYKQDTVHYYLCILDVNASSNIDQSKFKLHEIKDGDTVIKFTYEGTLSEPSPNDTLVSLMLPLVVSQKLAQPDEAGTNLSFTITDAAQNVATGNPNKGKPPVVAAVDRSSGLVSSTIICQSETATDNYFVAVIVNTAIAIAGESSDGGYANAFELGPEGSVLVGTLQPLANKGPVAAIGLLPSSLNQYDTIRIQAGTIVSSDQSFTYDTIHPF